MVSLFLEFERLLDLRRLASGDRRLAGDRDRRRVAAGERDLDLETDLASLLDREFRDLDGDLDLVLERESRSVPMFINNNVIVLRL